MGCCKEMHKSAGTTVHWHTVRLLAVAPQPPELSPAGAANHLCVPATVLPPPTAHKGALSAAAVRSANPVAHRPPTGALSAARCALPITPGTGCPRFVASSGWRLLGRKRCCGAGRFSSLATPTSAGCTTFLLLH